MVYYSFWVLPKGNIHYPAQEDVYLDGYYIETFLTTQVDINIPVSTESLTSANRITAGRYITVSKNINYQ